MVKTEMKPQIKELKNESVRFWVCFRNLTKEDKKGYQEEIYIPVFYGELIKINGICITCYNGETIKIRYFNDNDIFNNFFDFKVYGGERK